MTPTALTIAGSDPSGGAGIQADLKAFSALRVYGMAVVTALTAQNTEGIRQVFPLPEGALEAQLDAVLEGHSAHSRQDRHVVDCSECRNRSRAVSPI